MNSRDAIPLIYRLCGGILCFAGAIAAAFGILAYTSDAALRGQKRLLLVAAGGAAAVLFGIAVIALSFRSTSRIDRLIKRGETVYADITGIVPEPGMRVNGDPVYRVECQYTDPLTGNTYTFRSRTFYLGEKKITKDKVKVYVDSGAGYKDYLVVVEDILPK